MRKKLPSKVVLTIDESKVPKKILDILHKGLDMRKHPYCVAFSTMQGACYRGTWGNGSFRFLHCVCKMIDEGTPKAGTTILTGIRAMKGWGTCEEDLWPSNLDLSVSEFEDWKSIPREAWDDAKQKRIRENQAILASWPSESVKLDGQLFHLVTSIDSRILGRRDAQYDLRVIGDEFETAAWAQVRAYVESKQIILEDLFVKPEFRRRHLGSQLLHRVEQISCLEPAFSGLSKELLALIPTPDAGQNRYVAVREFFLKNGYTWKNSSPVRRGMSYSMFTAVKNLDCAEIHSDYAVELLGSKKFSKAEKHFKEALRLKDDPAIRANYAVLLRELKRYNKAERQLRRALKLGPNRAETHYSYANLMRKLRRYDEEEMYYQKALELKEDFPEVHNNYGNLLRKTGKLSDAESHFQRALEIREFPEAHYNYALLLVDLSRWDEAESHYKRTLELKEDYPEANNDYAKLLFYMGRDSEAERLYERAIEIKEDYADAHAGYALLLACLKRYEESEQHYRRAIDLKEKLGESINLACLFGELGALCEEQGKLEQAEDCYNKVLNMSAKLGHKWLESRASYDLARVRQKLKK